MIGDKIEGVLVCPGLHQGAVTLGPAPEQLKDKSALMGPAHDSGGLDFFALMLRQKSVLLISSKKSDFLFSPSPPSPWLLAPWRPAVSWQAPWVSERPQ